MYTDRNNQPLRSGSTVTLTSVDMLGLNGRDYHPQPEDEGTTLILLEVVEDDTMLGESEEPWCVWRALIIDESSRQRPRYLEVADYEVTKIIAHEIF